MNLRKSTLVSEKFLRIRKVVLGAFQRSIRRFPLQIVAARLVEKSHSSMSGGEVCIGYAEKRVPIMPLGARSSNYRSVYQIVSSIKADSPVTAMWQSPGAVRYEVHGQSVASYDLADGKIAELLVSANVPTKVGLVMDDRGRASARVSIDVPGALARLSVLTSQFAILNRGMGKLGSGWKSWENNIRLNYFLESPTDSKRAESLTVVFSALSAEYDFTYNYRSALDGSDCHRLFVIDDFGSRGSYYFADHGDTVIYEDVQRFLGEIIEQLGIPLEHVIFAGSSKGGTAALLHGLALGAGKVVIGAPQVYVGSYLQSTAPEVLEFIAGGRGQNAKKWLDEAIYEKITATNGTTDVHIIVGAKDHHLPQHVMPLLKVAANTPQRRVRALVVQGIAHSEIGTVYRHYLKNVVDRGIGGDIDAVIPHEIVLLEAESRTLEVSIWRPENELVACHLYMGQTLVEKRGYTYEEQFIFSEVPVTSFRFRFYRKRPGDADPFAQFYSVNIEV